VKDFIKAFAIIVAVTMTLTCASIPASADEIEISGNGASLETVDRKTEAAAAKKLMTDAPAESIDQDYIDQNDGHLPGDSGDYVLSEDINVSAGINVTAPNSVITIDLNGYKITYSGKQSMYKLGLYSGTSTNAKGIVLTLKDTSAGNSGLITVSSGYVGGGSIANWDNGNSKGGRGGCVLVETYNKLILDSVTIEGFKSADEGGGICVADGSEMEMHGGKITGCSSKNGGAISVSSRDGLAGKIKIDGAEISGNTASNFGGGLRILKADFELNNVVIKENVCSNGTGDYGGGGIHYFPGGDSVKICGATQIYENSCGNSSRADLFFYRNDTIDISGIGSGARIAFGARNISTSAAYFSGSGSCLNSFTSNNSGYVPVLNATGNAILLAASTALAFYGTQLVVGGQIIFKVFVKLGTYDNENTSLTYSYSYTKGGKTTNIVKDVQYAALVDTGDVDDGQKVYCFTIPVESACMTAPVKCDIHYGTSEEVSCTTTVEENAVTIINGNYDDDYKAVARTLLKFGSCAQTQFNINTDKMPDSTNFAAGQNELAGASYSPDADPNGAYQGASLVLLSQTNINLFFSKSAFGSSAPDMTVTYSGNITKTIKASSRGNYYVYTIKGSSGEGIPATAFDQAFAYSVGDVSGTYSALDYLKTVKKSGGNGSSSLVNLVEAYYNFAMACKNL